MYICMYEVIRTPAETRSLTCKSHDNKILAGERNAAIAPLIKKHDSSIQNVGVKGRNVLCNVVGLDAFARFASYPQHREFLPLIVLVDLLSAFSLELFMNGFFLP